MQKLFIGNLAWSATEEGLAAHLAAYGTVHSVKIITDRETNRSRGFGFAEIDGDPSSFINALNGKEYLGRPLRIENASARQKEGGRHSMGD